MEVCVGEVLFVDGIIECGIIEIDELFFFGESVLCLCDVGVIVLVGSYNVVSVICVCVNCVGV